MELTWNKSLDPPKVKNVIKGTQIQAIIVIMILELGTVRN